MKRKPQWRTTKMDKKTLQEIVKRTSENPYAQWNNPSLVESVKNHSQFSIYLFNKDGNHGYFSLLHNLTSSLADDALIVELGNREGLGILSIYDALKESQTFYTLDIVNDVRFIGSEIANDSRVNILNDFNSLDAPRVEKTFKKKSISMIFMDTIHTYEQVVAEYETWKPYLKDDCVILVDDIRPSLPGRTKWGFHEELKCSYKEDVGDWAHNDTGFGVYFV